jgi:hypothetical protein
MAIEATSEAVYCCCSTFGLESRAGQAIEDDASDDGGADDEGAPPCGGAAAPAAAAEYETYADGDGDANDDR